MYPFIHVFSLTIPSYGICMTLGLLFSCFLSLRRINKAGKSIENAIIIIACSFGCAIVGAVTLYMLATYPLEQLIDMLLNGSIFSVNNIGLVFYGGFLGAIPGAFLGAKITDDSLDEYIPYMIPYVPIGHAIGRIGCFLGGCCYGVPTSLPIGVVYHDNPISDAPKDIPLFPTQLVESGVLILISFVLIHSAKKNKSAQYIAGLYCILYSIVRFFLEFLRYDSIRGYLWFFSTSQWISIPILVLGIVLAIKSEKEKLVKQYCKQIDEDGGD